MGSSQDCTGAELQVSEVSQASSRSRSSVRIYASEQCPRQDSNLRSRLRRPLLSPLSYGGSRTEKGYQLPTVAGPATRPGGFAPRSAGLARPAAAYPAVLVCEPPAKALPSRPWHRDWDAC